MTKSLYGWILAYLQSDGKCDGCTFDSCARFTESLFCPYTGTQMKGTKRMYWYFTDAEQMTREVDE